MRFAAVVLAVWAVLLAGGARAEGDVVSLTLDQAIVVAQQAVLTGDVSLGYAIARRLVDADPTNARAQLLIAATAPPLGLAKEGRLAGRLAWRLTDDPGLRYEIARYTAKASYIEGRTQAVQFWLRRAADLPTSPQNLQQTVRDLRSVRDGQRLRYAVDVSVSPSNNLNNGARGGLLTIDDWFTVGPLTADARALSGLRAVGQVQLTYQLGGARRTIVGLRGYTTVNKLSGAAQNSVQGLLTGSDLNMLQLETTIAHQMQLPGGQWPVLMTGAVGNTWAGGQDLGPHFRIEAISPMSRDEATRLTLSGEVQGQNSEAIYGLAASVDGQKQMAKGTLSWRLGLRRTEGQRVNNSYNQISSEIGYAFGNAVGPVSLSLRAGGSLRDYPEYSLVVANVTGGRQDRTATVGVDVVFQDLSVLGYAPRISVTATKTQSNISRFVTQEIGITLGIQSKF